MSVSSKTTRVAKKPASKASRPKAKPAKPKASRTATATPTKAKPAKKPAKKAVKPQSWESRAVVRLIEAGSAAECPYCEERVKFRARHRDQQVICNVYIDGAWNRVEQYHLECYGEADKPHGKATKAK